MKKFLKMIIRTIVWVEVIAIVSIGLYIYIQRHKGIVLGKVEVVPISEDSVISSSTSELRYFYELKPNQKMTAKPEWLPYEAVYTINADTLNERHNYEIPKPPGFYRVITLGDSFTFGHLVSTSNNWTELLEDKFNTDLHCSNIKKFEVINLGSPGYGVEYISHKYETRGLKYQPDLVIWLESGSGFSRVNEILMPSIKKFEAEISEKEKSDALNRGEYIVWTKAYDEMYRQYTYDQISEMVGGAWNHFFEVRGETRVLIATFSSISSNEKDKLIYWSQGKKNVAIYDELPDTTRYNWQLLDQHPSMEGHKMIAENIFNYLKNNYIITCTLQLP